MTWSSRGRSKTTAAPSRQGFVSCSRRCEISRGRRCRRCVRPSFERINAPLLTIIVSGESIWRANGMAKSYLRPVTSATSMPRRTASAIAARLAAGSCQRLSSSVPSMSKAIKRTAISPIVP